MAFHSSMFRCGSLSYVPPSRLVSSSHNSSFPPPSRLRSTFRIRYENTLKLRARQRQKLLVSFASNKTSPREGEDSLHENSDGITKPDTAAAAGGQGPPFLTIFAGLVVFFMISWVVLSIVFCLFGILALFFLLNKEFLSSVHH